jgi:Tfp pilus assembly pilus retraction ATPase PilT
VDLNAILAEGVNHAASDIHLKFGVPPILRVNGHLLPVEDPEVR